MPSPESVHISVLLNEAVDALAPKAGGRYLDGTVGMGGHSFAIMERTGGEGFLCGLDRDTQALELARIRLAPFGDRVHLVHTRYSEFEAALDGIGWDAVDGALIDIGVSSLQIDSAERGFSFSSDGPLDMRMDRQQENARAISSYLLLHPLVKSVHYPGLPGHEYELASNGLKGGGAVLSFEVVPGVDPADVLDNLHIFRLAVSLGAVESLAELPCRMTHFELPREERLKVGITDELVRLAVGIEDKQDIIEDLGQAFDIAYENYLKRHAGESLFTFAQHVYA